MDKQVMQELDNCPFCGGEAEMRNPYDTLTGRNKRTHFIICTNCAVRTRESFTRNLLAQAWNRRAEGEG